MPKKKGYDVLINGEPWIWEHGSCQAHYCCDCGLKHQVIVDKFTTKNVRGVKVRFYRDDYGTMQERKRKNIKIRKVVKK